MRGNYSAYQLRSTDPLEHQLERANYHCDFAKRQVHRLTLLLRDVVAGRDVLRGQAEQAAVLQAHLHAELQQAVSERDAWRSDAHQLRNEPFGKMAPHRGFIVESNSPERNVPRVHAEARTACDPNLGQDLHLPFSETNVVAEDVNGMSQRPIDQELEILHVKEADVQCNLPDPHLMLLDDSDAMTELAMHRGLAVMSLGLIKGLGGRYPQAMRRMPGVSWAWLRGSATPVECSFAPAIIKAASNLVVSGLGAIHRSGAGTLCVEGLKEHAVQVACKYIFLVPLDADAATFWKAHGFAACVTWNPVSMGLGPADVQALQDVLYIPDPTDCDVMAYPAQAGQ